MADTASHSSASAGSATIDSGSTAGERRAAPAAPVAATADRAASGGGGLGRLVAAIVVAAVVSGAVTVLAPQWQPLLGLGGKGASPDTVPALQQDVAALSEKQDSLAAKTDLSAAIAPMQDQIAKLKAALDQLSQSPAQPAPGDTGGNAAAAVPLARRPPARADDRGAAEIADIMLSNGGAKIPS